MISLIIRNAVFILVILYIIDLRQRRDELLPGSSVPLTSSRLLRCSLAVVAIAVVLLTLSVVLRLLAQEIPALRDSPSAAQQIMRGLRHRSALGMLLLVIPAMILVGYSEELFFRAYLIGQFRHLSLSPVTAVMATAAIFAVGHAGQGIAALLFAFFSALFLGAVWLRLPRLHVLALGHSLYNIASLLLAWDGQAPTVVLY